MNIDNAKKLVGQLERLPDEKFWMSSWIAHPEEFAQVDVQREASCGTVGCIGGWAFMLNDGGERPESSRKITKFAQEFLGLTPGGAGALFYGTWTTKSPQDITRADAIAELNRLIAEAERAVP